jgi:hypothetical protein
MHCRHLGALYKIELFNVKNIFGLKLCVYSEIVNPTKVKNVLQSSKLRAKIRLHDRSVLSSRSHNNYSTVRTLRSLRTVRWCSPRLAQLKGNLLNAIKNIGIILTYFPRS